MRGHSDWYNVLIHLPWQDIAVANIFKGLYENNSDLLDIAYGHVSRLSPYIAPLRKANQYADVLPAGLSGVYQVIGERRHVMGS